MKATKLQVSSELKNHQSEAMSPQMLHSHLKLFIRYMATVISLAEQDFTFCYFISLISHFGGLILQIPF